MYCEWVVLSAASSAAAGDIGGGGGGGGEVWGGGAAAGNVRASRQLGPAFFHYSPSARVDPEYRRDGCFNDFIICVYAA